MVPNRKSHHMLQILITLSAENVVQRKWCENVYWKTLRVLNASQDLIN